MNETSIDIPNMSVAIITDSVASLPKTTLPEEGIYIVPILLNVDGESVEEGQLTNQELLQRSVKTSAPSPGAYLSAIEKAREKFDEVLILTVSRELSSSYSSGELAIKTLVSKFEESESIKIIDTQNASAGQGLIVLAVAAAARRGAGLKELSGVVKKISSKLHLVGMLGSIDQLVKTGRIPAIAGWASNRLGIKPLFEIREGQIKRMLPARNLKSARQKIVTMCKNSKPYANTQSGSDPKLHLALVHSGNVVDAEVLETMVKDFIEPEECFTASFSQSLIAAAGEGVSGIAWYWED